MSVLGTLFDDLEEIVGRLTPKQIQIGDKLKLLLDIKSPGPRQQVREMLRPRVTTLTEAVNEVIQSVRKTLAARGSGGPVIIVDNLDRVPRTQLPNGETTHDRLFVHSAHALSDLDCHVIYTVPPAVLLSQSGVNLHLRYGAEPAVRMPMIPVRSRANVPHEAGKAKLREMIEKRVRSATGGRFGADDVFESKVVDDLCLFSGGFPRQLIGMTRAVVRRAKTLPVGADVLRAVFREWRDSMTVANPEEWNILRELRHSQSKQPGAANENWLRLLENLVILEYRDDESFWYDVNPVLWEKSELQLSRVYEDPEAD
jgi:hypothetical protein